jgi:hypothetical protein
MQWWQSIVARMVGTEQLTRLWTMATVFGVTAAEVQENFRKGEVYYWRQSCLVLLRATPCMRLLACLTHALRPGQVWRGRGMLKGLYVAGHGRSGMLLHLRLSLHCSDFGVWHAACVTYYMHV